MTEPKPTYLNLNKTKQERRPWICPGCGQPMPYCYVQDSKLHIVVEELTIEITGLARVNHNSCDNHGMREWHTSQAQMVELLRLMGRV